MLCQGRSLTERAYASRRWGEAGHKSRSVPHGIGRAAIGDEHL